MRAVVFCRLVAAVLVGIAAIACGSAAPVETGAAAAGPASTAATPSSSDGGPAPTDAPVQMAPAVTSSVAAAGSMSVTTKAVELTVEGVTTMNAIGGRHARSGHEFVVVSTSWKNVVQPPQPFAVPRLQKQLWLFTDERFADTVDLEAQGLTAGALEDGFALEKPGGVLRGKVVFEAPAGPHYRAFQFYDNEHGHALIPLGGTRPSSPPPIIGTARQNTRLQMAVSQAGFVQSPAPAGFRRFVVGLRGVSRSPTDVVDMPLGKFVFAQTDQGCVVSPERESNELTRPFGEQASFPPSNSNEGQLAFLVPADTENVRVLITPSGTGSITLPAGPDFTPVWPKPSQTVLDGSTLRLHVLPPSPARPAGLPAPASGREHVLLDLVIENLKSDQGIDFDVTQQLRLVDAHGEFIEPSSLSSRFACRLGEGDAVPAGNARRFTLVYDMPTGSPIKLQYRGFEKDEAVIAIKR
jgi:hypothetical protein